MSKQIRGTRGWKCHVDCLHCRTASECYILFFCRSETSPLIPSDYNSQHAGTASPSVQHANRLRSLLLELNPVGLLVTIGKHDLHDPLPVLGRGVPCLRRLVPQSAGVIIAIVDLVVYHHLFGSMSLEQAYKEKQSSSLHLGSPTIPVVQGLLEPTIHLLAKQVFALLDFAKVFLQSGFGVLFDHRPLLLCSQFLHSCSSQLSYHFRSSNKRL